MTFGSHILVACFGVCLAGCGPSTPRTFTHVVTLTMNGVTLGEERASSTVEGQRVITEMRTSFKGPPTVLLETRVVVERGRPTSLRVSGEAPPSLQALVDVTVTPDRTDLFPLRAALPVHLLSMLVRHSIVTARRRISLLPDGEITIVACPGDEGPFRDAICHALAGLPSGPALVWIDERQELAAAVLRVSWGVIVANTPERGAAQAALLSRFDIYSAR